MSGLVRSVEMGAVIRRLLPALLLVTALALAGGVTMASPATAACTPSPLAAAVGRAPAVFTGTVASSAAGAGGGFVQVVAVDRVFRGEVLAPQVRVRTRPGTCQPGQLASGRAYVFLVSPAGDSWRVSGLNGAQPLTPALQAQIVQLTGNEGTPVTETRPPAPEVTFERVASRTPPRLLRVAAPGLAVALAGLLGLLVVRRR